MSFPITSARSRTPVGHRSWTLSGICCICSCQMLRKARVTPIPRPTRQTCDKSRLIQVLPGKHDLQIVQIISYCSSFESDCPQISRQSNGVWVVGVWNFPFSERPIRRTTPVFHQLFTSDFVDGDILLVSWCTTPEQTPKPNKVKPNQTKSNQTKPNQTKPNRTEPNQSKPNQHKHERNQPKPDHNRVSEKTWYLSGSSSASGSGCC